VNDTLGSPDRDRRTVALVLWLTLGGVIIALAFAGQSAGGTSSDQEVIYKWSTFAGGVLQFALLVGLTLGIASTIPPVVAALGLRRFSRRHLWQALAVVAASAVVSAALEPLLHAGREQGLEPTVFESDRIAPLVANSLFFVVLGPFSEELLFRGLGVTALGLFGPFASIAGTAVVFGLAHGIPVALPALVFLGLGLGWVRERSGSVWPGFFAHAAYNAIGIAIAVGQAAS
jgi:membrane protease YdiL (CAAX protease family)